MMTIKKLGQSENLWQNQMMRDQNDKICLMKHKYEISNNLLLSSLLRASLKVHCACEGRSGLMSPDLLAKVS